jgi:ABC-2 type transport system permease protein
MMRSIFTKTLREYRVPILGWGFGLALLIYFTIVSYAQLSVPARQDAAKFAATLRFFGDPVALTTPVGYASWKQMGTLPLILGIWTVLAGARLLRREEERHSLDILLATPRSRVRVLIEKLAALVAALAMIGILIGLGAIGGESKAGAPVHAWGALLAGFNVSLAALVFALLALLFAQVLRTAGAAAGLAGTVMVLTWLVDGTARVANAGWLGHLSPMYYYDLSKPLIPSYGTNVGGLLVLAMLVLVLGGASMPLFLRRDIGSVAWPSQHMQPLRARRDMPELPYAAHSLRAMWERGLAAQLPTALWWIAGLGIYAGWVTGIARSSEDNLKKMVTDAPKQFNQILGGHDIATDAGFLAGILFLYLPLLLVVYALVEAGAWARDLDSGSLELVLATPVSRARAILERFGALTLLLAGAPVVIGLLVLVCGRLAGLSLDTGYVAAALLGILPLELVTASVVFLLAGRAAAGINTIVVGGLVALSFFASLLYTVLNLPAWVADLSMFYQYGSPITDGPRWGSSLAMTALAATVLALGVVGFTRADVQRGQ